VSCPQTARGRQRRCSAAMVVKEARTALEQEVRKMYVIRERLFRLGEDSDITDQAVAATPVVMAGRHAPVAAARGHRADSRLPERCPRVRTAGQKAGYSSTSAPRSPTLLVG
jgi:hypothetical protein